MGKKVLHYFRNRPGLCILIFILSIITFTSIRPDLYLLGWDNYSSYFNLKTNIFRTFFATWREYRGFGVASDAESTDVFRQLFSYLIHFFISENLLDQVFYICSFWTGILGMYLLGRHIWKEFNSNTNSHPNKRYNPADIFGFISALFYLFNLNTLSNFYSPIIPFTNRFFALPLFLYLFLRHLKKPHLKNLFILIITVIVTSGSNITPTVMITTVMALGVFLIVRCDLRKAILSMLVFLLLNSFWLLPFFNYVVQKSAIVPLARTFIEINEDALNRDPAYFSFNKQIILRPSFVDIQLQSITGHPLLIHPSLGDDLANTQHYLFYLFPILYGIGAVLICLAWKKNKKILWIPVWILIFIFLSCKETGLLGFLYIFLKKNIPYFEMIFRFGDTKFHQYIALAGSLSAAYFVLFLLSVQKKIIKYTSVFICLIFFSCYLWMFRSYFTGNFINPYVYTKIPSPYFKMAEIINADPEQGRALHLPVDNWNFYWRPFSWGYLGSAFYQHFLNKPYIDKTFEPASMENAYLHNRINVLLDEYSKSTTYMQKDQSAMLFLRLLQKTNVKYVIIDETIGPQIVTKNILYTSKRSYLKIQEIMDLLMAKQLVVLSGDFKINSDEYLSFYKSLYPVSKIGQPSMFQSEYGIRLYSLIHTAPVIQSVDTVQYIDQRIGNLLETDMSDSADTLIQGMSSQESLFPFMRQEHTLSQNESAYALSYPLATKKPSTYTISTQPGEGKSYLIEVTGKRDNKNFVFSFYHHYYPAINGASYKKNIGTMNVAIPVSKNSLINDQDAYKLKINDVYVAIPADISHTEQPIASYILHENAISVSLLEKKESTFLTPDQFISSTPFSCYGPVSSDPHIFDYKINNTPTTLTLDAQDFSTCLHASVAFPQAIKDTVAYIGFEVQMSSQTKQIAEPTPQPRSPLRDFVNKENVIQTAYVCLKDDINPTCLNKNNLIQVGEKTDVYNDQINTFLVNGGSYYLELGAVPSAKERQSTTISQVKLNWYSVGEDQSLSFFPEYPEEHISLVNNMKIEVPKAISAYSSYFRPGKDMFSFPLDACEKDGVNNRIIRYAPSSQGVYAFNSGCIVSYFEQKLDYNFQSPYLVSAQYWVGAGQQPSLVMTIDKKDDIFSERPSLYQGYPNLPGLRQLNSSPQFISSSRLLAPRLIGEEYHTQMNTNIFQNNAADSLWALKSYDIVEYPLDWYWMRLTPAASGESFVPASLIYSQILPSLWNVTIQTGAANQVIRFSQGYDSQWGVYDGLGGVLFGKSIAKSMRCDGFANCFQIDNSAAGKSLYIFYWPERLNVIGWGITLLLVIGLLTFKLRKK